MPVVGLVIVYTTTIEMLGANDKVSVCPNFLLLAHCISGQPRTRSSS